MAWFALMRHCGAPARILDFTFSLFIAAYFALESPKFLPSSLADTPVVWAINRTWLTNYLNEHVFEQEPDAAKPAELERSWFEPYDHKMFCRLFIKRDPDDELIRGKDPKDTDFITVLNTFRINDRILLTAEIALTLARASDRRDAESQILGLVGRADHFQIALVNS